MPTNPTIKQLQIGSSTYDLKALKAANQSQDAAVVRDIQYGTNPPSGGDSGAVYLQYNTSGADNLYVYAEDTVGSQQNAADLYYSKNEIDNIIEQFFNRIYPVGSIYMSVNNVSPGTLFGGTWQKIENQFLLASGSSYSLGSTGGAATVTLAQSQIPNYTIANLPAIVSENHRNWNNNGLADASLGSPTTSKKGIGNNGNWISSGTQWGWTIKTNGGGQAHNNMPPYLVVNVWKRTA